MRVGVAVMLLVAAGCFGGQPAAPSTAHPRPSSSRGCGPVAALAAGHGWRTRSTTSGGLRIAEATTATYHESEGAFPDRTLRALPPDGILVAAWDYGRARAGLLPRPRGMPYRLADFHHDRGWEGQPAVNVPQDVLFRSLRHHLLDVRVFFGRQDPGRRVRPAAQAELTSLQWHLCTSNSYLSAP